MRAFGIIGLDLGHTSEKGKERSSRKDMPKQITRHGYYGFSQMSKGVLKNPFQTFHNLEL